MTSLNRRGLVKKAAGLGAIALTTGFGLALSGGSARAEGGPFYRVTSRVNLRKNSNTSSQVLTVIPTGAQVLSLNKEKNGFRAVAYNGYRGWAHGDYLELMDGNDHGGAVGSLKTTSSVNFRREPSTSAAIIQVVPGGKVVDDFGVTQNGFRKVGYAQTVGWIHSDYLTEVGGPLGGWVVTTTRLNLRAEPSTTAKVLLVMPEGAKAFRGDVIASGFLQVTYNGTQGWAHQDYLKTI